MARETPTQLDTVKSDAALLLSHEQAARAVGAMDLADLYKRARRELTENSTFRGLDNTRGVQTSGVRH